MHQVVYIYKIYKMFPPVCRNFEVTLQNSRISLARHNRHGGSVRTVAPTDIYTVPVRVYFASQCQIIQIPTDAFRHDVTKEISLRDLVSNEVYTQNGPKKCIHSLLINIFGINLNEISISG